ncbi:protein required for attachment to host cells [Sphingomonas insulae]|uniref:Host attachment protein n=1 Tax=Sphingomonas insulae TaxID=424800 RepID=A0ABN1HSD4_9SPHN|nr:host attachment family protein [Sphingomonas insulae]NIJ28988.1 protein required for attachment to host cells [Sphingomonas insulae]
MQVPHNAFVLVADGRKALFFRNEGDAEFPNLQVEHAEEHVNPADRDQKTDAAGASSSTRSGADGQFAPSRGSMGETDYHQQEEDRFAADMADMLKRRALANAFEALIIVAPPKTLGELRKHYHKEVSDRLKGELAKDLTGHPVPDIEQALRSA